MGRNGIHGPRGPTSFLSKGGAMAETGVTEASEALFCPLCIEPLDSTEMEFFPCPCGYQVCLFCFDRVKNECSNLCPGCRTPYGSDVFTHKELRGREEARSRRAAATSSAGSSTVPPIHQQQVQPVVIPVTAYSRSSAGTATTTGQPGVLGGRTPEQQHDRGIPPKPQKDPKSEAAGLDDVGNLSAWPSLSSASSLPTAASRPGSASQATSSAEQEAGDKLERVSSTDHGHISLSPGAAYRNGGATLGVRGLSGASSSSGTGSKADPEGAALLSVAQQAIKDGKLTTAEAAAKIAAFVRQREGPSSGQASAAALLQQLQRQQQNAPAGSSSARKLVPPPGFGGAPVTRGPPPGFVQPQQQAVGEEVGTSQTGQRAGGDPMLPGWQQKAGTAAMDVKARQENVRSLANGVPLPHYLDPAFWVETSPPSPPERPPGKMPLYMRVPSKRTTIVPPISQPSPQEPGSLGPWPSANGLPSSQEGLFSAGGSSTGTGMERYSLFENGATPPQPLTSLFAQGGSWPILMPGAATGGLRTTGA